MTGNERMTHAQRAAAIRELNDSFRQRFMGGTVYFTQGVLHITEGDVSGLLKAISSFSRFDDDNDLHGEHDFGNISWLGEEVFWKIDYYDKAMSSGSPDPADPRITARVMTVMLSWEY